MQVDLGNGYCEGGLGYVSEGGDSDSQLGLLKISDGRNKTTQKSSENYLNFLKLLLVSNKLLEEIRRT